MSTVQPTAEAVAVKGDRVVKIGTTKEVNALIGEGTRVVELGGRTVVAGFVDCHVHVVDFGKFLSWVDLSGVSSIEEVQERVGDRVQKVPKGRWVIGNGWNEEHFVEKRCPSRWDLDVVSPDNPVVLYHGCGRVCVVNSRALELAGVTKETAVPSGGVVEKDSKGEVLGVLREAATDLVWRAVPEPCEEEVLEAARLACERIVAAGIVGVHWIVTLPSEVAAIQKVVDAGLPLRARFIVPLKLLKDDGLGVASAAGWGVEVDVDGYLAAKTAALKEPYIGDDGKGELFYTQEELDCLVLECQKAGVGLVLHVMGDEAVDMALTSIEKAVVAVPKKCLCRLEHAAVLNAELAGRIKRLGLTVCVQPRCVVSEFSVWSAVERLGEERARWLYPLKTLFSEGVCVVGGSDCPMEPLSPLEGVEAAVTRQPFAEQQLTVDEALRMYTVNAAHASHEEDLKGSIEEGKLADFTVLSDDPRTVPHAKIGEIAVEMTIVGGKIVYQI
jgi:predicted amidohydrolase YtcJ